MKTLRFALRLAVCILAVGQVFLPSTLSAQGNESPIFLKLNEYYVFHATPIGPTSYAGSLFVPATLLELMGFTTTIAASHTMAILRRGETSLTATVDRSTYEVDPGVQGVKPQQLSTKLAPRRHQSGEMLIPVRILIDVFRIRAVWDAQHRILHLQDAGMMRATSPTLSLFEENLLKTNSRPTQDLVPISFSLGKTSNPDLKRHEIRIVLKDISVHRILPGQQALYTIIYYVGGPAVIGGRDLFVSTDLGRSTDPCHPSGTRVFTCIIQAPIYQNAIQYIVGVTRVRSSFR